jgi:hypothetical protein
MSTHYKHQEAFAIELANAWHRGHYTHVRAVIRTLKNKAQASYIAARVALILAAPEGGEQIAYPFVDFLHPNFPEKE